MKFNPNRYDLILLFAVVSGIYYVIDETLVPRRARARGRRRVRLLSSQPTLSRSGAVVRQPLEIYTKGAYSLEPDLDVERRAAVAALPPLARAAAARTAATPLARQPPPHL